MSNSNNPPSIKWPSNLFFIKRFPKRKVSKEWVKNEATYDKQLDEAGFITEIYLQTYARKQNLAATDVTHVETDMGVLNRSLVTRFFEHDQLALFYQNQFYLYHWILVLGAFSATFISVLISYAAHADQTVYEVFWLGTILSSLLTAVYTVINKFNEPQQKWYRHRRIAEALRMHYFLYVCRIFPYNGSDTDREDRLLEKIGKIIDPREQVDATGFTKSGNSPTPDEIKFLQQMYLEQRVQKQLRFYLLRVGEYNLNALFVLVITTALMTLNVYLAAKQILFSTAIIPSLAALLMAFQQMYGWDRQRVLYQATYETLKAVSVRLEAALNSDQRKISLMKVILECETIFSGESEQWGQTLESKPINQSTLSRDVFHDLVEIAEIPEDQKSHIQKILESGQQ